MDTQQSSGSLPADIVGAITHDLRQPVTALSVNVHMALQFLRESPPNVAAATAALEDAAEDIERLRDSLRVVHGMSQPRHAVRPSDV